MKITGLLYATLVLFGLTTGHQTHELKEADIKIDLTNEHWFLADKQAHKDMVIYFFKRESIEDVDGRQIIPNISVIIENLPENLDAVTYSAIKRSRVNFEVLEVYTKESGKIDFQSAVGYKGKYTDKIGLDHTIFILHGVKNKKGIQLICDVTTNILDQVEYELLFTLKSLRESK